MEKKKKQLIKRPKKSKFLEVVGPDGKVQKLIANETDTQPEEDPSTKIKSNAVRRALQNQGHQRKLPHLQRADCNSNLRRIATKGVVTLFNAVKKVHEVMPKYVDENDEDIKALTSKEHETKMAKIYQENILKNSFLDVLRKGTAVKAQKELDNKMAKALKAKVADEAKKQKEVKTIGQKAKSISKLQQLKPREPQSNFLKMLSKGVSAKADARKKETQVSKDHAASGKRRR